MRKVVLAVALGGAVSLARARPARAESPYVFVVPGYLYANTQTGPASGRAHGVELSVHGFHPSIPVGLGLFGQLQKQADHARWAAGAQVTLAILGFELGFAHRDPGEGPAVENPYTGTSNARYAATHGVQLGPFLSFGVFVVGYRWVLPVGEGGPMSWGKERGFTVAVKLPLQVSGRSLWDSFGQAWSAWK